MRANFLPGISVELWTNGQKLKEFNDEDTVDGQRDTVTRYVEAVPNTEFSVHVVLEDNFRYRPNDLSVSLKLDGQTTARMSIRPRLHVAQHREILASCVRDVDGVGRKQRFAFGELKTCEFFLFFLNARAVISLHRSFGLICLLRSGRKLGKVRRAKIKGLAVQAWRGDSFDQEDENRGAKGA